MANLNLNKWLHGLGAAFISGGASAVVSGLTTMGFAPNQFNLTSLEGFLHLLGLCGANFFISGLLGMNLYLKQSPLPDDGDCPTMPAKTGDNPDSPLHEHN